MHRRRTWSVMRLLTSEIISIVSLFVVKLTDAVAENAGHDVKWGEFCEFQVFNPTCQPNEVIVMETALCGRMNKGNCVKADLGYVGCRSNVLDILDRRCSGRRSCEVKMPDPELSERNECLTELKLYLEASYRCQKVVSVDRPSSCRKGEPSTIEGRSSGYIANMVTIGSQCGSPDSPWMVRMDPGRRINVTLVNFASNKDESVYATIKEPSAPSRPTITVSGGEERHRHVFTSYTNSIEIRLMPVAPSDTTAYFLIHFQAVGCRDVAPPVDGWSQRAGEDHVTVGCNRTQQTWQLRCESNEWKGDGDALPPPDSCTGHELTWSATFGAVQIGELTVPHGMSIIIVVLVAVFVGIVILSVGLVLVRRHYARQDPTLIYRVTASDVIHRQGRHGDPEVYGISAFGEEELKRKESLMAGVGNVHGVDRDGYTHIWERPLPTPHNPSKLADSSSCPMGLVVACSHGNSGSVIVPADAVGVSAAAAAGAHGNYLLTPQSGDISKSLESIDDQKYYQLDTGGDGISLPAY